MLSRRAVIAVDGPLLETLTPGRRLVYVSSIELRGADICRYVSHNPQFNSRHEHIFILLEQVLDWAEANRKAFDREDSCMFVYGPFQIGWH